MNDSTCPRPCLMKLDLQSSTNKLAFLKDNWPSFGQIESIDRLSETELRCTLCLLDVVLAALAKDECFCPNREIIRLVLTRTYVQNRCELCETEEIRSKLVKGFCTREKKNGLSRKNNIRRRGISVFYGAILRMLSLFSSFRKEENRDTIDFLVSPIILVYSSDITTKQGRLNQKREPFPGSDSTPIFPPICSTILWQMESPRPVPCTKEFNFTKRSKICA